MQAAEEIEKKAETAPTSAEDATTLKKKMLAEQDRQKKEYQRKLKEKKDKEEKAKKDKADKARKIEEAYKKLQKEHGGLHGTEDTGYDDSSMDAYLKRENVGV